MFLCKPLKNNNTMFTLFVKYEGSLQKLLATIHKAGSQYLSQESQMLNNQVGTFCLPRATFSADDNALTQKMECWWGNTLCVQLRFSYNTHYCTPSFFTQQYVFPFQYSGSFFNLFIAVYCSLYRYTIVYLTSPIWIDTWVFFL